MDSNQCLNCGKPCVGSSCRGMCQDCYELFGRELIWGKGGSGTDIQSVNSTKASEASSSASDLTPKAQTVEQSLPLSVHVRVRPLVGDELAHEHPEMKWDGTTPSSGDSCVFNLEVSVGGKSKQKSFKGFQSILQPYHSNEDAYSTVVAPLLPAVLRGQTACVFAYGHTGSGKTHTMFGYDSAVGMYRMAASSLCAELEQVRLTGEDVFLEVRFYELYQGKLRDLLGGWECAVRQNHAGDMHVRGPVIKSAEGKVRVQPLKGEHARTPEEVQAIVGRGLSARNVGSSSLHDLSSRSHAILEMEIVTPAVVEARMAAIEAEAELVPVGKQCDDMRVMSVLNPSQVDPAELAALNSEVQKLTEVMEVARAAAVAAVEAGPQCTQGTVVIVDLAGNEYAADAHSRDSSSSGTKEEEEERREINKSLFSLKECIRGLHNGASHVPFRGSKLTMILRRHLTNRGSIAAMVANVSSSAHHARKTSNTLAYSELMACA